MRRGQEQCCCAKRATGRRTSRTIEDVCLTSCGRGRVGVGKEWWFPWRGVVKGMKEVRPPVLERDGIK